MHACSKTLYLKEFLFKTNSHLLPFEIGQSDENAATA